MISSQFLYVQAVEIYGIFRAFLTSCKNASKGSFASIDLQSLDYICQSSFSPNLHDITVNATTNLSSKVSILEKKTASLKMDVIMPESEETMFFTKNEKNDDDTNQIAQDDNNKKTDDDVHNECLQLYEYGEDMHDTGDNHASSSRSDLLLTKQNVSSRRRINVVASNTNTGNQSTKNTTGGGAAAGGGGIVQRLHQTIYRKKRSNDNYDISYHPNSVVLLYAPPRQRQKWGEQQVLPRVNWGDLFFDLFYVAATYNVASIINDQPNGIGLLYTAGTFLPVMNIWTSKTHYDARYVGGDSTDDLFHRCLVLLACTGTGIIISNIRTVSILSNASEYISMFLFTCCLVMERIFNTFLYIETYFYGVGQRTAIKASSYSEIFHSNASLPFFLGAMIISAIKYFGNNYKVDTRNRLLRWMAESSNGSSSKNTSYSSSSTTNIPIILCLLGCIAQIMSKSIAVIFCLPKHGRHKEITIPINVDFVLHRSGEWMMLILGKSIFSLLIVDVSNKGFEFYVVFYCSLLIVILLQLLHFQTQPHHADLHAVRRSKNRGMIWSVLQSVYSLALVIMGATYTFFLLFTAYDATDTDTQDGRELNRYLAGSTAVEESDRIGAAHLFSGSLAIVFASLNIMDLLHMNIDEIEMQCLMKTGNKYIALFVAASRIGIIVGAATISQWTFNQKWITTTGLILVLTELAVRKLACIYILSHRRHHETEGVASGATNNKEEEKNDSPIEDYDDEEEATWPNVMHARVAHDEKE